MGNIFVPKKILALSFRCFCRFCSSVLFPPFTSPAFISEKFWYRALSTLWAQKGLKAGFFLLVLLGLTISVIMYFSSTSCLSVFLEKGEGSAISYGTSYLKIISVFYALCFIGNVFVGYFRGIGRVMIPFIGTTSHLTLRVILTRLLISRLGLSAVTIATGAGWILVVVYQLIMYRKART